MASIVAIGNPGVGKSTILNALAGEHLFKSGISIGSGLTYQLDEKSNMRGRFFDTPGLADDTYRKAAGEAIRDALRMGGRFKVLFFVMTESGRVVRQDVTTLKLVLDSCPELGNRYGIVINKVSQGVAKALQNPRNAEVMYAKLFSGIDEDRRCPPSNMTYILHKAELDSEDDKLVSLDTFKTLGGNTFADFIYNRVPTVELTPGRAKDIKTEDFDQINAMLEEKLKAMEKLMENDREKYQKELDRQNKLLEKAEREKDVQRQEDRRRHEEQMNALREQINIKQEEIAISRANQDAERRIQQEREHMQLVLKQQQDNHQQMMAKMAEQQRPANNNGNFADKIADGFGSVVKGVGTVVEGVAEGLVSVFKGLF